MARVRGHAPQRDEDDAASVRDLVTVVSALRARSSSSEPDFVPSLEPIAALTKLLGDPQGAYQAIHLTGTNGKTSTSRMIERLLREHGLRTGRFTSPDLGDPRDLIAIDGTSLSAAGFVDVYREVAPFVDLVDQEASGAGAAPVSSFEFLVAMAYAAFAEAPVEVAVVEVGMGGERDATNVINAGVAVVTSIALDHERFLGHDLATIATAKAGIIKPGAVAVLSDQPDEAMEPLLRRAAEVGATVLREGHDFAVIGREVALGGQLLTLQGREQVYEEIFLPLHGGYQAHNAAAALAAVEAFLLGGHAGGSGGSGGSDGSDGSDAGSGAGAVALNIDVVRAAFADVDSPGRLEVVRRSPTVLVDAAHNPAGAQALAESLAEAFGFTDVIGLVAVLDDKDAEGILGALEPVLSEIVISRTSSPRCLDPVELGEIAIDVFGEDRVQVLDRLDDALDYAMGQAEFGGQMGAGVLATGSVTMAAEVRALLTRRNRPRR
jgi:dihydrofolate synthase / folylpolyglutamate synthase